MSRPTRNSPNGKKSGFTSVSKGKTRTKRASHKPARSKPAHSRPTRGDSPPNTRLKGLIWGQHAVIASLNNSNRHIKQGWITAKARSRLDLEHENRLTTVEPSYLDELIPDGAAHQGIAVQAGNLPGIALPDLARPAKGLLLVLDQITDPHNVGTIFRIAAAFGAKGIIMQDRNAPPLDGATAKVAVGYVETIPACLVTNIADSLITLKESGWIVTGLAGETDMTLEQALAPPKNATHPANVIVLGAEGPGLRPRVRTQCDYLARIPMPGGAESLNVATAAAIAAYEASKLG